MNNILADLEFNSLISEAQAQTATGVELLNKYKVYCMSNECTCNLINSFIKEANQCIYDNGVHAVLEEISDYVNSNKIRWQIATACESINANQTSYNYLNRNAAKQAEKLLDLNEEEAVKYIKAGALKNVMFCEAFRSIAKSVFKNQPMMEANAEFSTIHPISITERVGSDVYFEAAGSLYKIDEDKNVLVAEWNEVSNTFKNVSSLLESNNVKCVEDTLFITVGNYEYQISESNKVTKLSKETETEMTVEQLREDNQIMVRSTNPRYKNQIANILECVAQVCENYDRIVRLDNVNVIASKNDRFIVVESDSKLFATLLNSTHNPKWTINESVMSALDFIKSKTKIDLSENYKESIKKEIAQVSEAEREQMEKDLEDKSILEMKDRIATLTEKFKNDPAKLAVLSKLAQDVTEF